MRKLILIVLFYLCGGWATAQVNYVLNPSLEQHDSCPSQPAQIRFATFWSAIDTLPNAYWGSPEYCNACDTTPMSVAAIPFNYLFNDYPRTGNGLAMVLMFADSTYIPGPELRDYLQGRLYKPLIANKTYCVTFYVLQSQRGSIYSINHIGAYLDNGTIDTAVNSSGQVQTQCIPQIVDNNVIDDTLHWTKIEGSFTATGIEKFITIGNFYDIMHTTHVVSNPSATTMGAALYLVDDVSVIESNHVAFAGNDTAVNVGDSLFLGEIAVPYVWYDGQGNILDSTSGGLWVHPVLGSNKYVVKQTLCGAVTWDSVMVTVVPLSVNNEQGTMNSFQVWPNPNNGNFTIKGTLSDCKEADIEIINSLGQKVYSETAELKGNKLEQQLNLHFSPGVYTLRIKGSGSVPYIRRLVIE